MISRMQRIEVHKFGGTSLAEAGRIAACAEIVRAVAASGIQVVAVASAMGGVTDRLVAAASAAATDRLEAARETVSQIVAQHEQVLRDLAPGGSALAERYSAECRKIFTEIDEVVHAVALLADLSSRTRDRILSAGEKMSARRVCWPSRCRAQACAASRSTPTRSSRPTGSSASRAPFPGWPIEPSARRSSRCSSAARLRS
jgi:aspartokinase